jgi:hypothetical protein
VHRNAQSYDDDLFHRRGKPIGRITNKESSREEAQKKVEEKEATEKVAMEKETKEVVDKAVEEERQKKDIAMRNEGTQPMDIDILEVSTTWTNIKASFNNLRLGIWAPFQPSEVPNLRSFTYDRKYEKIRKEKVNKVSKTQGMLISVLT